MTEQITLCKVQAITHDADILSLRERNRLYWINRSGRKVPVPSFAPPELIRMRIESGRLWIRTDGIY